MNVLPFSTVTQLLCILREEGHTTLPKTAQTLLGTTHRLTSSNVKLQKYYRGIYIYLGVEEGLKNIICTDYNGTDLQVFVHIDGMQVYNNSSVTVWPILIRLYDENYITRPFIAWIYYSDSNLLKCNYFWKTLLKKWLT